MNSKRKNSVNRWIYARTKHALPMIVFVSLLSCVTALSYVLLARVSKYMLDSAATPAQYKPFLSAAMLLGLIAVQVILDAAISMLNVRISGKMVISMRKYMFSSVLHKKYPKIFSHHSGDLLNRFTSDIDQVVNGAAGIIPSLVSMLTKIIAGMAALLMQNYIFALIVLVVGIVFPIIGRCISKRYKFLHKEVQRTEGKTRAFLQESFANIVVVKTFESEKPISRKLDEYMGENFRKKISRNYIHVILNMCLYSFFTLGYYGIMLWGAGQIAAGAITAGTLIYYLQLVSILRSPLQSISGVIPRYYSMTASAERLMELENEEDEPAMLSPENLEGLKVGFKDIELKSVCFSYGDEDVLEDCTLQIPRGGITAITGESGSGKSTLFKLILGLYEPTAGSITFNGETPINSSTRSMFSYVPQGNMIISGTIRENITLCNDSIDEESVVKALKAAAVYDFVSSLPEGLETKLSERGAGLSEGQIQRISIARALLFDSPILLLDESTSALDEATETLLLSNIKKMTDKTVLFITHRNTSVSVCDRIIHLNGKHFETIK